MSSVRKGRASTTARSPRGRRGPGPRLRVLFLASQFPFPADSGATIKTLSVVDYLRERHDVRLVSLTKGPLEERQEAWAKGLAGVRAMPLDRGRSAGNLLRSYLSRVPLSIERNRSPEMARLVEAEIADFQPDVVFVDNWLMAQYLPANFGGLKVLHEHNAEYQLWERQAPEERGPRKWAANREAKRVRSYEAALLPRFDMVLTVSEEDRRALREIGGDLAKIKVLPNVPDTSLLELPAPQFGQTEPVILYFGTLSWQPNIEGLDRFLTFALKQIVKRAPEARLVVAGKGAGADLMKRLESVPNVDFVGEVEDPESLYARARVAVDAARTGGGTRLKILNALARGIPVVASWEAARGLDIVAGEHLIVARNEHTMIDSVVSLLTDPARWKILSENGRALIRARYSPETAFRVLDDVFARVPAREP